MTGLQCWLRQHPGARVTIQSERTAWQAYVDYVTPRSPQERVSWYGDDESRRI